MVVRLLPEILDPKEKTLVLQYEVKLQDGLDCGGAYIKLLRKEENKDFDPEKFTDKTPYVIMFGPDKCGSENKVVTIINLILASYLLIIGSFYFQPQESNYGRVRGKASKVYAKHQDGQDNQFVYVGC